MTERFSFLRTCRLAAVLFAAGVLGSVFSCATKAQAAQYIITDLGQMGDLSSSGTDINNLGQVIGYVETPSLPTEGLHTFLWSPNEPNGATGTRTDLAPFGGFGFPDGINDYGQVLTSSFLWTPDSPNATTGTTADLATLLDLNTEVFIQAHDINNFGQLVGWHDTGGDNRGYVWTPTSPNGTSGSRDDLLPSTGFTGSAPKAINDLGQVTGSSGRFDPNGSAATLWSPAVPNGVPQAPTLLDGTENYTFGGGQDINNKGQIAGSYIIGDGGDYRSFLWTPDVPNGAVGALVEVDAQTFTLAEGINTRGDIVGWTYADPGPPRAFLYTSESDIVDLNTLIEPGSGWHLSEAHAINDFGQIIGTGSLAGFGDRAFLLTPVPEPSSLALLALALPLIACRLRSSRTTLLVPQKGAVMRCLFALFCVTLAAIEPAGAAALFFRAESIPGSIDRPGLGNDWLVASGFGISVSSAVVDDPLDPPALEVTPLRIEAPASTSSPHIFAAVIQQTRLDVVQLDVVESSIDDGTAIAHWRIADAQIIRYESITENVDGEARVTDQFDVAPLGSLTYGFESYNIVGTLIGEAEFTWNLVTGEVTSEMHGNVSNFRFLTGSVDLSDLPPLAPLSPSLGGDYNQDGTVDAADYTVWRDNLGSGASLPNDDTSGVGPDDYTRWKANFGATSGPADGANAPVPEPSLLALLALALPLIYFRGLSGRMPSSARQASQTSPAQRSADAACRLRAR